jgi:hypothetical protein
MIVDNVYRMLSTRQARSMDILCVLPASQVYNSLQESSDPRSPVALP